MADLSRFDSVEAMLDATADPAFASEWKNERIKSLETELAAARAENERLMNLAVKAGIWKKAPCCLCGYSGAGYHQPATHKCAALAAKLEGG